MQIDTDPPSSANFCSCSKSIQRQTLACSTLSVPMFLCQHAKYAKYAKYNEYEHTHPFNMTEYDKYAIICAICNIRQIWTPPPLVLKKNTPFYMQKHRKNVKYLKKCMSKRAYPPRPLGRPGSRFVQYAIYVGFRRNMWNMHLSSASSLVHGRSALYGSLLQQWTCWDVVQQ